ncbi:hypothetical protein FACS1894188_07040 [Clostridia bacterium]|nr:hypothetical protein FACS1894188_07040 [Clostridia bacterium]
MVHRVHNGDEVSKDTLRELARLARDKEVFVDFRTVSSCELVEIKDAFRHVQTV